MFETKIYQYDSTQEANGYRGIDFSKYVLQGAEIGTVNVVLNGTVIARIPAVAADAVRLPGFIEGLTRIGEEWK